jgi:hypothetical protein
LADGAKNCEEAILTDQELSLRNFTLAFGRLGTNAIAGSIGTARRSPTPKREIGSGFAVAAGFANLGGHVSRKIAAVT